MNNLRKLRRAKGLSLGELHRQTGYPLRTLEDWDAERKLIQSYHRIKKLSEILDCTVDEFMTKEIDCLYNGVPVVVTMFQDEDGVHVKILDATTFDVINESVTERENAVALFRYSNMHEDISKFNFDSVFKHK